MSGEGEITEGEAQADSGPTETVMYFKLFNQR